VIQEVKTTQTTDDEPVMASSSHNHDSAKVDFHWA